MSNLYDTFTYELKGCGCTRAYRAEVFRQHYMPHLTANGFDTTEFNKGSFRIKKGGITLDYHVQSEIICTPDRAFKDFVSIRNFFYSIEEFFEYLSPKSKTIAPAPQNDIYDTSDMD